MQPGNSRTGSSCPGIVSIAVAVLLRKKSGVWRCSYAHPDNRWLVVNIRSIWEFSGDFMSASMQSGAGYGLYMVALAGALVAAGDCLHGKKFKMTK